jgi:hypothetical protein
MKNYCLTTAITAFLLFCTEGVQAQTVQTKLNQVELMTQMVGSWRCDINKDTTAFWDAKSYGTGLECTYKSMTKGGIFIEKRELYGYDKSIDKRVVRLRSQSIF